MKFLFNEQSTFSKAKWFLYFILYKINALKYMNKCNVVKDNKGYIPNDPN